MNQLSSRSKRVIENALEQGLLTLRSDWAERFLQEHARPPIQQFSDSELDSFVAKSFSRTFDPDARYLAADMEGDDELLEAVCELGDLERLDCDSSEITDGAFRQIVKLPKLKTLSFMETAVTGAAFDVLPELPVLTELHCNPRQQTAQAAEMLSRCGNLRELDLEQSGFTSADVAWLWTTPQFEKISLSGCPVTDGCCAGILQSSVCELSLSNTACGDRTAEEVSHCPTLTVVRFSSTEVRGSGIESLGRLPNLIELAIGGMPIKTADVVRLGIHPTLQVIWLDRTKVDDRVLEFLQALPSLSQAALYETSISNAAFVRLGQLGGIADIGD